MELFRVQLFIENTEDNNCQLVEVGVFETETFARISTQSYAKIVRGDDNRIECTGLITKYILDDVGTSELIGQIKC